jgi:hypothetical protein
MSDFLDRLAARAIGSETALAPRLPSLFEPLQRAPIMPLADDGEASPRHREAASPSTATPTVAPMRSPPAPVTAVTAAARVAPAPAEAVPTPTPASAAPSTLRNVVPPASLAVAPTPSSVAERSMTSPTPPHLAEAYVSLPVQLRQARIAAERRETTVPSPSNGVLLPAATPVFAAARAADAPGRSIHAAAMHTRVTPTGRRDAASEPVVHVSIGRLEVRAAASAAAPSRRRAGPQPASLDDYLRQRGDRGSP